MLWLGWDWVSGRLTEATEPSWQLLSRLPLSPVPNWSQLVRKRTVFSSFLLIVIVSLAVQTNARAKSFPSSDQNWLTVNKRAYANNPSEARSSCTYLKRENRRGSSVFDDYSEKLAEALRSQLSSDFPTTDAVQQFVAWQIGNFCPDVW